MKIKSNVEIVHHLNGKIESISYLDANRKLHNDDGPAYISFSSKGKIISIRYVVHGLNHRMDGVQFTVFNSEGVKIRKEYWQHGRKHRLDGPALILFNDIGRAYENVYWVNGLRKFELEMIKEYGLEIVKCKRCNSSFAQSKNQRM